MRKREFPTIKFKRLNNEAKLPAYAHEGDAGFDVCCCEEKTLAPGERYVFATGLASEIPLGYFVLLKDRSSVASKNGVHVLAGIIDSGYRGEWFFCLVNLSKKNFVVKEGDRIAQGILLELPKAKIIEVEKLPESERGEGGFGSTGRR